MRISRGPRSRRASASMPQMRRFSYNLRPFFFAENQELRPMSEHRPRRRRLSEPLKSGMQRALLRGNPGNTTVARIAFPRRSRLARAGRGEARRGEAADIRGNQIRSTGYLHSPPCLNSRRFPVIGVHRPWPGRRACWRPPGGHWEYLARLVDHDLTRQQALMGVCHSPMWGPGRPLERAACQQSLRPMYLFFLALNCTILR